MATLVTDSGLVGTIVKDKFNTTTTLANGMWNTASDSLTALSGAVSKPSDVSINTDYTPKEVSVQDVNFEPISDSYVSIDVTVENPVMGSLTDIPAYSQPTDKFGFGDIGIPVIGDTVEVPMYTIPDTPFNTNYPSSPASITTSDIPSYVSPVTTFNKVSTTVSTVQQPVFSDIPNVDYGEVPLFQGDLNFPNFDIAVVLNEVTGVVNSLLNDTAILGDKIKSFISTPQQAIGDDVVNAMTASAIQQVEDMYGNKYSEVIAFYSAKGWHMPTGMLDARISELDRQRVLQEGYISRDVLIKNFELSQQNYLAAMQMYIGWVRENNSLQFNLLNEIVSVCKYSFDTVATRFNSFVTLYNVDESIWKTKLGTQIQEIGFKIEENKMLISKYAADVQKFGTEISAISEYNNTVAKEYAVSASVYDSQMKGIVSNNEVWIKKYQADIQKYGADVAGISEYNNAVAKEAATSAALYETKAKMALGLDELVLKKYAADIQKYGTDVSAVSEYNNIVAKEYSASALAYDSQIKGIVSANDTVIKKYQADTNKYSIQLQAITSENDRKIKSYAADISKWSEYTRSNLGKADVDYKNISLAETSFMQSKQLSINEAEVNAKNFLSYSSLVAEVTKAVAQIAAQMASSALSAVSASAQLHDGFNTSAYYDETKGDIETRRNFNYSAGTTDANP